MSSFLAIKKVFDLSASNNAQMLVSRQSRELSASGNDVVTTMRKHFDYTVDVSFDSAGGTACANAIYVLGKTYQELPTTTRSSHIFQGWYTQLTGGTQILAGSTVELSTTALHAQWKYVDVGDDYTEYVVQTTSSYKKTGIYTATRYDSSSPIVVDWGDGNAETIEGNISQLTHEYSSVGVFHVKISNISNFAASASNSTWYSTTSQNRYTFKDVVRTGSHCTTFNGYAFFFCAALSSINFLSSCFTSLTSIPNNSFCYCQSITQLSSLPSRIKTLGPYSFQYCTGLSGIQDLRNTGLTSFTQMGIFANCTGVKEFKLPNSIGTTCGTNLFSNSTGLSSFTIPTSLTAISQNMLYGCIGLKDITVPSNIQSINNQSFRGCTNLSSVTYETTALTSIGSYAFYQDYALHDLNMPDTVKNIGSYAFSWCYSTYASALTLPSALTSLGANAYQYCYNLKELEIPSGLTAIGNTAFAGCRSLSSITDYRLTAQTIGSATFGSASGTGTTAYAGYSTRGSNILWVPEGATGYDSSYWLDPLQNASKCGFNLSVIGSGGGGGSTQTTIVYADGTTSSYNIMGEFGGMNLIKAGIWDEPQSWAKQPISASIGSDVTSIGDLVFYDCQDLTNVTIPNSVTSIGGSAFNFCISLISVTIPDSVLSIGDNAFEGCAELTNVVMPSNDVYVGAMGFYGCDGLADANGFVIIQNRLYGYYGISDSITIPSNVTEIREEVFAANTDITTVIIPDSVTYIGRAAFAAIGLTSMTIPSSVTSIEIYAFLGCNGLIDIVISDNVTSIGDSAFEGCTSLAHVTINDYNGDADNVQDMMVAAGADSPDIVWNVIMQ